MALSLEMRIGESVFIHAGDETIEIRVTFIKGVRARVGFRANKRVKIVRKDAIKKEAAIKPPLISQSPSLEKV